MSVMSFGSSTPCPKPATIDGKFTRFENREMIAAVVHWQMEVSPALTALVEAMADAVECICVQKTYFEPEA